jgi:hypothetical protein
LTEIGEYANLSQYALNEQEKLMATFEQIARAKARIALAKLSGKKLPDEVVQRAKLDYSEAEDKRPRNPNPS